MLEFAQRLGLDLTDALPRDRELFPDLLQRVVLVHAYAVAHAQHAFFAWRDGSKHTRGGLAQVRLNHGVDGENRVLILDEIAETRILLVADGRLQGQRFLGDFQHLVHLFQGHAELYGEFFRGRLAADLISHLAARAQDLADFVHHMRGDADGDRKSTRLNSSHVEISYAVFCLKKKKG